MKRFQLNISKLEVIKTILCTARNDRKIKLSENYTMKINKIYKDEKKSQRDQTGTLCR